MARSKIEKFPDAHAHLAEALSPDRHPARRSLVWPRRDLREKAESQLADAEERLDEAVDHATLAVSVLEHDGDTLSSSYTSALNNLAWVYVDAGRFSDSVRVLRRGGRRDEADQAGGRRSPYARHPEQSGAQ